MLSLFNIKRMEMFGSDVSTVIAVFTVASFVLAFGITSYRNLLSAKK